MDIRTFLGMALAAATLVAACGDGSTDTLTDGNGNGAGVGTGTRKPATTGGTATNSASGDSDVGGGTGAVPTNSPAGKEFYKANVHPFLAQSCGGCHDAAGPGTYYLTAGDAEKSYGQLFKVGYVVESSRIVVKPGHGGLTTNVLTSAQIGTYSQWVAMELKDGGAKATPNILATLGSCFDKAKFDAMKMGQWQTTRRTNNNNTNNVTPWNENANNCTGCDNAQCTTCHSSDAATNFNNAVGNPILPADTTFENTKLTTPAYITKFFGVSADGVPVASQGLLKKSDATKKDKAYTHPMYTLNAEQTTAVDAFVNDAIAKFAAGTCGK